MEKSIYLPFHVTFLELTALRHDHELVQVNATEDE